MALKRDHLACLVAGLVVALLASAAAVSADQRVRLVRIKTQVGGGERVVAYGRSRLLLVPQETSGVRRIRLDGSVDRSFGKNGTASIASEDAVVTADGKILVATTSCPRCGVGPKSEARITRLLPSGRPDLSFGGDGNVDIPFGRRYNYGEAVALAANGDILLGGCRVNSFGQGLSSVSLVVARLRANGSLDRSFGGDGVSVLPGSGEIGVSDIAPTPSGGVVVDGGDTIETFLWKLRRDGSTDRGFGRSGIAEPRISPQVGGVLEDPFYAPEIAVLPGGKLLLAATGFRYRGDRVVAIRLLPDGRPDRSYGEGGWAVVTTGRIQAKGLTLLSGGALAVATSFAGAKERRDFGLIAFGPKGHLERRFGKNGRCRAGLGGGSYGAVDVAVVGGRAVVVGHSNADSRLLSCPVGQRLDAVQHGRFGN
jgi:uncharacterized delta-60 repeat protein